MRGLFSHSSGSTLLGHVSAGKGAIPRTVFAKLAERISVEDFGAVGDGVGDDTRAFNNALAMAAASGLGTVHTKPNADYKTTGTITVPTGVTLQMGDGSCLVYSGAGTAIRVEPGAADDAAETYARAQPQRRNIIRVSKGTIGWHDAAGNVDTASVGIQMVNQRYSSHELYATGFHVGVELIGIDAGYPAGGAHVGNVYTIIGRNNRTQVLEVRSGATGYVNQNTWIGGLIRNDSPYTAREARGFDGSAGANGWTFVGVNCEGRSMQQVFRFGGPRNTVINCRFENATPGMVKVLSKGGVCLLGCYIGSAGPALVDADVGGGWVMQSEVGNWSQNAIAAFSCYNARLSGTSGYWYRMLTAAGITAAEWEGGTSTNRLDVYALSGKYDARTNPSGLNVPSVRFDFGGRVIRFRAEDRASERESATASLSWANAGYLSLSNAGLHLESGGHQQELRLKNTRLWVDVRGRLRVKRGAPSGDGDGQVVQETEAGPSSARPLQAATGQMFFDTGLGKPIWWSATRWVDATGTPV